MFWKIAAGVAAFNAAFGSAKNSQKPLDLAEMAQTEIAMSNRTKGLIMSQGKEEVSQGDELLKRQIEAHKRDMRDQDKSK